MLQVPSFTFMNWDPWRHAIRCGPRGQPRTVHVFYVVHVICWGLEQQTDAAQRKNVRAAVREARKALIARYPDLGLDQVSASHLNWRAREQDLRAEKYAAIERAMLSMKQEDFERIYSSVWKGEILKGKKKSEEKTEQAGRLAQDAPNRSLVMTLTTPGGI
ncbi:hypothetical protein LTR22_025546 [Elasticomyces elasticus]|nr:hypothetical protein LTR22_025546 [Elasticomyces elasticus]KAK4904119.1 hypothetical protein LTR49_026373 [Elasticomyces elasticus]KAK5740166.1 hypothetical protein LTS12_025043 [Elasticomyces elasticus]